MDFDSWKDAVNAALKAQGKPFSVCQLDPGTLSSAYSANASPVVFAQTQTGPTVAFRPAADPRDRHTKWIDHLATVFFLAGVLALGVASVFFGRPNGAYIGTVAACATAGLFFFGAVVKLLWHIESNTRR